MSEPTPPKGNRDPAKEMPMGLIYGFVFKMVAVILIVAGVLWYSGVFG